MSPFSLLLIEVAISVVASTLVTGLVRRRLRLLLVDACGTVERADFWIVYSDAVMFIAPLVTTLAFGKSSAVSTPTLPFYKAALGSALFGTFVALAAIGLQLARMLPRRVEKDAAS